METLRHRYRVRFRFLTALLLCGGLSSPAQVTAQEVIPHAQDQPPGPALSPTDAIAKMTVPDGFKVELVASEPDIVNPVAMTFDERGRIWITESLEYPRSSPGVGRDRVKVIEDKDGDGKADSFTLFAEGLNIPSGIAVGHGGVWVANAPDILFLKDTDGDGKADTREVVVSGFGRDDTHELPNSLTWGPDGWLYGWNGVFNQSHIKHRGKEYKFTCAIFRIHPKTRDFEVFCEGTSNPWGIAWNLDGSAFASACVIDHLWHLTETGYYHRQGGNIPRSPGSSARSLTTSIKRPRIAASTSSTATPTPPSSANGSTWGTSTRTASMSIPWNAMEPPIARRVPPTFSPPTTPGSCPSPRRPGPTAASTSSTGTIAITATRTPAATPTGSIASKDGSIASATKTTRVLLGSTWPRRPTLSSSNGSRARTSTTATSPSES
ncbi:PVC-type heme-binding CxxCH protein [Singulisphaera sp. GP187]|uniref:PVC-type heme-binding CxxCH protein n=1 Tax=Singulisphaera sp. GP187 TaxID=1882752 RepID=UPI0020B1139B|nr:PVC-type heme-binding CxxCH protein [Singulisphaera sp. GP187]